MNEDLTKKKVQPLSPSSDLKSRDRKLKTTLMLSAITCLFMCVLGYEMVREEPQDTRTQTAKRFEIVNAAGHHQGFNTDQRQLALLNAQNQHLSHKILSLKEEAKSAADRLHTMQISILAAQKKIESDKVKALQAEISEKEQNQQKLQATIAQLESAIADHKEQILAMEASIETFQEMIELHKKSKEQLIASYKSKIDQLHTQAQEEKTLIAVHAQEEKKELLTRLAELEGHKNRETERLTNLVLDLEERQKLLKFEAAKQAEEMVFLEDELNKYSLIAIEKDEALDNLQADQKDNDARIQDLAAFVQLEQLLSAQKESELLYLNASHAAKQEEVHHLEQALTDSTLHAKEIENLLSARISDLALQEEALKALQLTKEVTQKEYEKQIAELTKTLENEQQSYLATSSQQEQQLAILEELNSALSQGLLDKDTAYSKLAEEKNTQELLLATLQQELYNKAASIEHLQAQVDLLTNDSTKSELIYASSERALVDELKNVRTAQQELEKDLARLSEEKLALETKLLESAAGYSVLEREMAERQSEIETLRQSFTLSQDEKLALETKLLESADTQGALEKGLAQHQQDLIAKSDEVERLKQSFALSEQEIVTLKEALIEEQARSALLLDTQASTIAGLQAQLEAIVAQNTLADARNNSLESQLSALQDQMEEQAAAYRLIQESDTRSEIIADQAAQLEANQAVIAKIQADYEIERQTTTGLEKQVLALKTHLADYESRLATQSEESSHALENQRLELDILDKRLIASHSLYEEAARRAESLEHELATLTQLASEQEVAFAETKALNQNLEQELGTYQSSLESTLAAYEIAQDKMQSYEQRLNEMHALLQSQQDVFTAKSVETATLIKELENASQSKEELLSKQYADFSELNKKYELEQLKTNEFETRLAELALVIQENAQELAKKNEESLLQRWENEKMSKELAEAFAVHEESSLRSNTLESKLEELSGLISMREQAIGELKATSKGQISEINRQSFELADTLSRYEFEQAKARELERQLSDLSIAIHLKEQEIGQSKEFAATQREINEALSLELTRHQSALSEALAKYELAEETLMKHEEILRSLEQQLSEKDRTLEEKENTLSVRTNLANELMEAIASMNESRAKLQKELERARGDFTKLLGISSFSTKLPVHNLEGIGSNKND